MTAEEPEELSFRIQALLSIQRALWDMVTPNLRGVALGLRHCIIRGRFLYETPPGNEECDIVSEVETYVLADFDEAVEVKFRAELAPMGMARELLQGEEWVFMRRERTNRAL